MRRIFVAVLVLVFLGNSASAVCSLTCRFSNNLGHPQVTGTVNCPGASTMSLLTDIGQCNVPSSTADTPFWSCSLFQAQGPNGATMSSGTMSIGGTGVFAQVVCTPQSSPTTTPTPTPTLTPTPSATPSCASIKLKFNGAPTLAGDEFVGYNWTQSKVDAGLAIPSLSVSVDCFDQSGNLVTCPGTTTLSASRGVLYNPDNAPIARIWNSSNTAGPVTISASANSCLNPTDAYTFFLDIENACAIAPASASVPPSTSQSFTFSCSTQNSQIKPCYPLGVDASPNLGTLSATVVTKDNPKVTLNTDASSSGSGTLIAAGPTFTCEAGVQILATPSPSTSPLPTATPNPSSNPSVSPSINPAPSASPAPFQTLEPKGSVQIECPQSVLVSPTQTVLQVTAFNPEGSPACMQALNVTQPDGTTIVLTTAECLNGRTRFSFDVSSRGSYRAFLQSEKQAAACLFSAVGSPPRPVDELNPAFLVLLVLGTFFLIQHEKR